MSQQANPVKPSDGRDAWDEWAVFSNNVSAAMRELHARPLFSERNAVARALWDMGYRPTAEQVESEREKIRQRLEETR